MSSSLAIIRSVVFTSYSCNTSMRCETVTFNAHDATLHHETGTVLT